RRLRHTTWSCGRRARAVSPPRSSARAPLHSPSGRAHTELATSSKLASQSQARDDGQPALVGGLTVVVVVTRRLDGGIVVDVLDVEVGAEAPGAKLPGLVEPHVELVEHGEPAAVGFALEGHVAAGLGRVDGRQAGRARD